MRGLPTASSYLPPGVTQAMIDGDHTVDCAECGAVVDADESVQAMGRDYCSDDCLWDWTVDHRDEVLERLRD